MTELDPSSDEAMRLFLGGLAASLAMHALQNGRDDARGRMACGEEVRAVRHLPTRMRLLGILDAVASLAVDRIASSLLTYGIELRNQRNFAAACEVFAIVSQSIVVPLDSRILAMRHRATTLCVSGKPHEATIAYVEAGRLARIAKDSREELEARLGESGALNDCGCHEDALAMAKAVRSDARMLRDHFMVAKATGHEAAIIGRMGEHERAVALSLRALPGLRGFPEHDRCRTNLAYSYIQLGRAADAAQIARELVNGSLEPEVRAAANDLLMGLTVIEHAAP